MSNSYDIPSRPLPIGQRDTATRSAFISRTYNHLMGAIVGFTLFEVWLFTSGLAEPIAQAMLSGSWLIVLGGFILVSWIATRVAHTSESIGAQYAALAGFVVFEGIIFVPMLYIANTSFPGVIQSAAFVTMAGFAGLTAVAFVTRKDFSFLRSALMFGGALALVAIVSAVLFGFELGTFFSVAMVGLAGASILYDTSNILRDYPEDRYVGAALQLFASVAMMFWYVLRIFMASRD
ncbi:MAG: US12 family protein [Deltaproteobacteria bacterium]|nr:US12 family protein [Deltaproteobacteria bacterium]MBW2389672.1 US12 family protein [Deltaproteobacteria bacterium]MBW2724457.1 US12 family protein [Deltaproteobacteria bacterium]